MIKMRAFTMIELLIVVSVIAILAATAVPNFLHAQIRSKVSRTLMDQSALATACAAYYADYQVYPPNHPEVRRFVQACAVIQNPTSFRMPTPDDAKLSWSYDDAKPDTREDWSKISRFSYGSLVTKKGPYLPAFQVSGYSLSTLTTPIAYGDSVLLSDPFSDFRGTPYGYINIDDAMTSATVVKYDERHFIISCWGPNVDQARAFGDSMNPVFGPYTEYDPTNGTISKGDILKTSRDFNSEEFNLKSPTMFPPQPMPISTPVPVFSPLDPFAAPSQVQTPPIRAL